MSLFSPRQFPEIIQDMLAELISSSPLTDVNFGSVFVTFLEAAAQEDDEQYFQMLEIIRGYSLDTTFGDDLDNRAAEYNVTRSLAFEATSNITITDTAFTKIETDVYAGAVGSPAGATYVNGSSATGFSTTGSIIVGRGTTNVETVPYSSITVLTNYVVFNLSSSLAFDHGTDESIILAQGGDRVISAGTVVKVPASDTLEEVVFTTDNIETLLDGENVLTGIEITAAIAGSASNVPIGAIQRFDSPPFSTATVSNPQRITNGVDDESDQELRDKIKDTIQSLSKGTPRSIITGVNGLVSSSDNKRVVSVSLRDATVPTDVAKLFIDDGTGFIPDYEPVGLETVVASATGGEQFLFTDNIPLVKAFVETQDSQPFNIADGATLFVEINGLPEVITFTSSDFLSPGAGTAQEVLKKINDASQSFEARVTQNSTKLKIFARENTQEEIRVTGGTANTALNFPLTTSYTSNLYLTRDNVVSRLSKDGRTASIEAGANAVYDFSIDDKRHLSVVVDGKINNILTTWFIQNDFLTPGTVNSLDIVSAINDQTPGLLAVQSSNDTRFTLLSKTERSSLSKIMVLENFTTTFNEEVGVDVDRTTEFQTAGSNVTMFAVDNDYVHLGHADVPFNSVFVKLATVASSDIFPTFEYFKSGTLSFTEFGVNDETLGFTQDGHILFYPPIDWAKTAVNGVTAYWLRIRRNQPVLATPPVEDRIRICGANEEFQFSEIEDQGIDFDYKMNRFIGQLELTSPLIVGDKLTFGSDDTRASLVTSVTGNYGGMVGTALELTVDGVFQTYTFIAGDFAVPASASPTEIAAAINREFLGVTASTIESGTKVKVISNLMSGGSLISGGTANVILSFPSSSVALFPLQPASVSDPGPFTFDIGDTFLAIIDGNTADNQTVPVFVATEMTGVTSTSLFQDSALINTFPNIDDIKSFDVEITSGAATGDRREISAYNPFTGDVTLTSPLSALPASTDTYQVIPKSTAQVVSFLNNTQITLISTKTEVKAVDAGTRVQIASKNFGTDASVSVVGGTANDKLSFPLFVSAPDAYRYYTGLAQLVQKTVDGVESDPENFEGIRAAGVQIEVLEPVRLPIDVQLDVTTSEGVSLTGVAGNVKSAVTNYINNLDVGDDVIGSDLIVAVRGVDGISDAQILFLSGAISTGNIPVADNELARINESSILVG